MPDATTRAGILAKEGVISYYFAQEHHFSISSGHFATCNNQGRHFDEQNVKKSFRSLEKFVLSC
jgi:hypothetical protein